MQSLKMMTTTACAVFVLSACSDTNNTIVNHETSSISQAEAIDWNNNPNRIMGDLDTITTFGSEELPANGIAEKVPYPGNWWPLRKSGINQRWDGNSFSPAEKYDLVYKNWKPADDFKALTPFSSPGSEEGWQDDLNPWYNGLGPAARAEVDQSNKRAFDKNDNDGDGQTDEADDWDGLEGWFGHCNGWAAAAISTDEPVHPAYQEKDGETVAFEISDIKALLTDAYYSVNAGFLSRRCNRRPDDCGERSETSCLGAPHCNWQAEEGENPAACEAVSYYTWTEDDQGRVNESECRDTNPASLHIITTNYLGRHKKAYVIDATHDWQVWNYPVYKYDIVEQDEVTKEVANEKLGHATDVDYPYNSSAQKFAYVKMKIWYVSDAVEPHKNPIGHKVEQHDYEQTLEYVLELSDSNEIIGGEWVGTTRTNHPDFVWVPIGTPYVNNPEISWANVEDLYQDSRSGVAPRTNVNIEGETTGIQDTAEVTDAKPDSNRVDLFVDLEGPAGSYTFTLTNPDGETSSFTGNVNNTSLTGWFPYDFAVHDFKALANGTLNGTWTLDVTGATKIKSWTVSVWEKKFIAPTDAVDIEAGEHAGNIEASNGEDWYTIDLVAGATINAQTTLQGLTDTKMWLLGPDGAELAFNDDVSGNNYASAIEKTVSEDGTYYLKVTAYSSNQTGTYGLNVTVTNPDPADPCAVNNGGCDAAFYTCNDNDGAAECVDINECTTNNGGCDATYTTCVNNVGAAATCRDIDECLTNNGGCGDAAFVTCGNNEAAAPTCTDIDECAVNFGGCTAGYTTCVNNYGAAATCADIDECATNNGSCGNATFFSCSNNVASAPTCEDINECASSNGGCGDATFTTCTNNVGAVATCTDINECAVSNGGCGNATYVTCSNNTGAAPTCNDINECAVNNGGCPSDTTCLNNDGVAPSCQPNGDGGDNGGFNWGGACDSGSGDFNQPIEQGQANIVTIGDIPAGKADVFIQLTNNTDVDVQLIDKATGHQLVAWPAGDLNDRDEECVTWEGVEYCYSGYNGDCGTAANGFNGCSYGNEWIRVNGTTNRTVTMRAFGYAAGNALVEYSYAAPEDCVDAGSGSFNQPIEHQAIVTVGTIPAGKANVYIELTSDKDVDVQLIDAQTGTKIIAWVAPPAESGLLNGASEECTTYEGLEYCYSGYNGVNGQQGHEWIRVSGTTNRPVIMKAFGYAAGNALIEYSWGPNNGE